MNKKIITIITLSIIIFIYLIQTDSANSLENELNGLINEIYPLIEMQNEFTLIDDIYPEFYLQEPIGYVKSEYYSSTLSVEDNELASVNYAVIFSLRYKDEIYKVKIWGDYTDKNDGFIMYNNNEFLNSVFYKTNDNYFSIESNCTDTIKMKKVSQFIKSLLD